MKTVLTIAGSDSSGGAGIQADIKTVTAHGLYAMSAITALTAQNTTGVYGIFEPPPEFLAQQLDCIFTDIPPDAVKIGMVSSRDIIQVIAAKLRQYQAKNIVADPVMVATSGGRLLVSDAVTALQSLLLPLAGLITPNIPEAEVLAGFAVRNKKDMEKAAEKISAATHTAVLVKGGHLPGAADDLLFDGGSFCWIEGRRIDSPNTHGTGCTLSSAIACRLAEGRGLAESVTLAKEYITGALEAGLVLGKGNGPLNHCYRQSKADA